jgi:hypothetical protein
MSTDQPTDQRLRDTLRSDLTSGGIGTNFIKELREIRKFYVTPEKEDRLKNMNVVKRWFFIAWWILKSMLLKMTPFRRLLLVLGIFLAFLNPEINSEGVHFQNMDSLGSVIILVVLMLELKDKLLARDELEAGRKVQQVLMPERNQSFPGWSVWVFTRPANEVGGDLVDYLELDDDVAVVTLADVSGKGLKAALLTAKIQATVRALAPDIRALPKLVAKINEIFHRDSMPNIFASLLYVELKPNTGKLRYVNAGHYPPILLKGGTTEQLAKGEAALGLVATTKYSESGATLQKGDFFVAYSDGVTEASNVQGGFFGIERLLNILSTSKSRSVQGLGEEIVREVDRFVGEAYRNDDLSLVILKKE